MSTIELHEHNGHRYYVVWLPQGYNIFHTLQKAIQFYLINKGDINNG